MKKLFLTLVSVFLVSACSEGSQSGSSGQVSESEALLKEAFFQQLELKPRWSEIEYENSSGNSYRLAVIYNESSEIPGYAEVSEDTKLVAKTLLTLLVEQGRNPREEWISIFVNARQRAGTGETGAALVRRLGKATYNYNSDQIIFSPPK